MMLLSANALLVLTSQIYLPFEPVPVTGQTFAVLLVAATLGSRYGTAVVVAYLLQGGLGLPVFSQFNSGIPLDTAGYLVGFIPAAYLVGRLYELRKPKSILGGFSIMALGTLVIYVCGAGWLATMVGLEAAVVLGVLPFLIGDAGKAIVAALAARAANAPEPGETPA